MFMMRKGEFVHQSRRSLRLQLVDGKPRSCAVFKLLRDDILSLRWGNYLHKVYLLPCLLGSSAGSGCARWRRNDDGYNAP
jgi:hypothetical protein